MSNSGESEVTFREQISHLSHPKNVLKTVASQIPLASAAVEILNQLEGQRMDQRIAQLEADARLQHQNHDTLAATTPLSQPPALPPSSKESHSWPLAVGEYLSRIVEFAVVHTPDEEFGDRYVLAVGNGCLIGDNCVLTSGKVLDMAQQVAMPKRGRVVILIGLVWYEFKPEPVDKSTGLVLCRITIRNEKTYQRALKLYEKAPGKLKSPTKTDPNWTITPVIGQEIGFILPSDVEDNRRITEFTPIEFNTSIIAHFKRPKDDRILAFVTCPIAGRIMQLGAPVFSIEATLLGIISNVEKYEFDVGRRAVVTALFGFPRFTAPTPDSSSAAKQ